MIVVLDTSCISAFIRAGEVELLVRILEKHEIVLTEQVAHELKLSKLNDLRNFNHPKIKIRDVGSAIAEKYNIHIGEASVIMFAKENGALAVIDDKKAREAAKQEGVEFIGTATLLKLGLEKGAIKRKDADMLIEKIIDSGRLYMTEEIKKWILG